MWWKINFAGGTKGPVDFLEKARHIARLTLDKNAVEPVLLHVTALCSYADVIVICHGRSTRQVQAIVDYVAFEMKKLGERVLAVEGANEGLWELADFGDVVLHVFYEPMRPYYDLEGIWPDAPRIDSRAVAKQL
jgi:ribosome-associated protein